ncbi:MAG: hypothetical protein HY738_05140 [Bacteroidia bacterium]|nr:hypothetical protein [Bacteroidia bacterium]
MKTLMIATIAFILGNVCYGAVITVSNNPNSPGQYTNLQTAIDNAAIGDTIYVSGSPTSYGDISFNKSLVLIGAGYNNPYGENTIIGSFHLNRLNATVSASNSVIKGFYIEGQYAIMFDPWFSGGTSVNQILSNITIERCKIINNQWYETIKFSVSDDDYSYQNITIQNCLIEGNNCKFATGFISYGTINNIYANVIIRNNIFDNVRFDGDYYSSTNYYDLSGVTITNNIFINQLNNHYSGVANAVVQNNIFYAAEPQGCIGCTFTNNITYLNTNDTLVGSSENPGSIGSGNMEGTDPKFVNFPYGGAPFSYSHDYHLQSSSPGQNAGTDGTDIGIYGGGIPYEVGANPNIPQMTEININDASIPVGGTLQINFKAKKQD